MGDPLGQTTAQNLDHVVTSFHKCLRAYLVVCKTGEVDLQRHMVIGCACVQVCLAKVMGLIIAC